MENAEPNLKPQPTGGLKLMTVFIAVLALHVVVIGGFTVWHLLNLGSSDDVAIDKTHKAKITSDTTISEVPVDSSATATADKTASDNGIEGTSGTDAMNASTPSAPATASTTTTPAATPAPTTTASTVVTTPVPPTPAPSSTPSMPATPQQVPAMSEDPTATAVTTPAPATPPGPIHHGPVVTPPDNLAPPPDTTTPTAASVTSDTTEPTVEGTPYTVKKGDSLAKIAHRHHVALTKLRTANGLASDSLHIGQKLVIPNRAQKVDETAMASAPAASTATPSTDTTSATSAPDTSVTSGPVTDASSAAANPPAASAPVQAPVAAPAEEPAPRMATTVTPHHHKAVAASSHHIYTVVKGDTLTKIAKRYHTTTSALIAANGITNAARLSIGQKLRIPAHESRAAATSQPAPVETPEDTTERSTAKGQLANYVQ